MRRLKLATLSASIVAGSMLACVATASAEPKQLWEVSEVKNPESALADLTSGVIFVANVNGGMTDKDSNGFISTVSLDGRLIKGDWVTGLDAPKGLATIKDKLYVADIDQLVEIDIKEGKVLNKFPAKDAKFLNDVAASSEGHVYVSDTGTDTIWRLADGKFEPWLQSEQLTGPNGLLVQGDQLIVASFGKVGANGPEGPSNLKAVSLADKTVKPLGDGSAIGNLDGLEALDATHFLVTDFMGGKLLRVDADTGKAETLLTLTQGAADIAYIAASRVVIIPNMTDSKLTAYKLD